METLDGVYVVGQREVDGAEVGVGLALATDVIQILKDRKFLKKMTSFVKVVNKQGNSLHT